MGASESTRSERDEKLLDYYQLLEVAEDATQDEIKACNSQIPAASLFSQNLRFT